MSATTTAGELTVHIECDVANTLVLALAFDLSTEGEILGNAYVSTTPGEASPGDLSEVHSACERITRLAGVIGQLKWRAHHGAYDHPKDLLPLTADEATLLDVAARLRKHADADGDPAPLAKASRVLARAVADVKTVTA